MGGRALKQAGIETRRVDADEYFQVLCPEVLALLDKACPGVCAEVVPAYRDKTTFGDMDVVVDTETLVNDWREQIQSVFRPRAVVSNGNVLSFDYKQFQIDLIRHVSEVYEFARHYYAWNDLGNLIGRIARRAGFKFGHDGLWYVLRAPGNESRVIRKVLVSRNFNQAIQFLGFSAERYHEGFDFLDDIFRYVADSEFFDSSAFPLEHRSHNARIRDRKRPTYMAFLRWVDDINPADGAHLSTAEHLDRAFDWFPAFKDAYEEDIEEFEREQRFRSLFSGDRVRELTGLEGKELGEAMARIVKNAGGRDKLRDRLLYLNPRVVNTHLIYLMNKSEEREPVEEA